ncbi:hypothetical protein [Roseomonas sp. BN140053]|uniref:hypothetical protein n=1 Tax=Roseomonas sp. BN140053 TaxID=3391898 RepID=UPI0039EC63DD
MAARPRVCVCFSGQMRHFEGHHAWLAELRNRAAVEVVVTTWKNRGAKVTGPMDSGRLGLLLPPGLKPLLPASWQNQSLFLHLPALRRLLIARSGGSEVSAAAILAEFGPARIHIEDDLAFGFFENRVQFEPGVPRGLDPFTLRQFYKVFQGNVVKRSLEQEQGAPFDLVLRLRPDLRLAMLDLDTLLAAPPEVLFVDHHRAGIVGDQAAAGGSDAGDIVAGFFWHAFRRITGSPGGFADPGGSAAPGSFAAPGAPAPTGRPAMPPPWREVHSELHDWLRLNGLTARTLPGLQGLAEERFLRREEVADALRGVAATAPDRLGREAGFVLGTLEVDAIRAAGDAAGAARRGAELLREAPEGLARNGLFLALGRAQEALGETGTAFLCGALALAEQPADASRHWHGPDTTNEEMNLLLRNIPGQWSPGTSLLAAFGAAAAAAAGRDALGAALAAVAAEPAIQARQAEAAAQLLQHLGEHAGLQQHLARLLEAAGRPAEAARVLRMGDVAPAPPRPAPGGGAAALTPPA